MVMVNLFRESGKFRLGVVITLLLIVIGVLRTPLLRLAIGDTDPMAVGTFGASVDLHTGDDVRSPRPHPHSREMGREQDGAQGHAQLCRRPPEAGQHRGLSLIHI